MNKKFYILIAVTAVILCAGGIFAEDASDESVNREYRIKAGYLYNFFAFVDWPGSKSAESSDSFRIGVVCVKPMENKNAIFEKLRQKTVNGRSIEVILLDDIETILNTSKKAESERGSLIETIKDCHMIMICGFENSKDETVTEILNVAKGSGVLTVGHVPGFIDDGGNINFVNEGNKIRFEINLITVRQNKLSIRSKLLKLATRVIDDTQSNNEEQK